MQHANQKINRRTHPKQPLLKHNGETRAIPVKENSMNGIVHPPQQIAAVLFNLEQLVPVVFVTRGGYEREGGEGLSLSQDGKALHLGGLEHFGAVGLVRGVGRGRRRLGPCARRMARRRLLPPVPRLCIPYSWRMVSLHIKAQDGALPGRLALFWFWVSVGLAPHTFSLLVPFLLAVLVARIFTSPRLLLLAHLGGARLLCGFQGFASAWQGGVQGTVLHLPAYRYWILYGGERGTQSGASPVVAGAGEVSLSSAALDEIGQLHGVLIVVAI